MIFLLQEGGEKCKIDMSGYQTMHICDVSKPSAYVWNIFQASPGDFPVTRGGRNVKLICQGTKQCMFVMFPSPQHMFGIFLASPGDFPVTRGGRKKCKIDMSGYQTMHICDFFKPSANVWNISG